MTGDGVLWYSTPTATVGLVVVAGVVVDGPPYARRWALGREVQQLVRVAAGRPGVVVRWLPDRELSDPGHNLTEKVVAPDISGHLP